MVTLVVATIVMTTAVPGFRKMIQDNQLITGANELVSALHLARNEAIKRGERVTVCKSANGTSCAGSGGWEQGWIVFNDPANPGVVDGNESVLRIHGALNSSKTLRGNNNVANRVSFLAGGFAGGTNGQLIVCDDRARNDFNGQKADSRVVIISTLGRPRIVKGDDPDVTLNSCSP